MLKRQLQKFSSWMRARPFNTFVGMFSWIVLGFTISQLILHPLDFTNDPWISGGLRLCILIAIPVSFMAAIYIHWYPKEN